MLAITLLFLNVPSLSQREFYFSLLSISSSPNLISKILIFSNNRDVLLLAALPLATRAPSPVSISFTIASPSSFLTLQNTLLSWAKKIPRAILLGGMLFSFTNEKGLEREDQRQAYILSSSSITDILNHPERTNLLFQQ